MKGCYFAAPSLWIAAERRAILREAFARWTVFFVPKRVQADITLGRAAFALATSLAAIAARSSFARSLACVFAAWLAQRCFCD